MNVNHEEVIEVLVNSGSAADLDGLTNETSLQDIGVDSLDMSNFLLGLEEKFDIQIPDDDIDDLDTVDAIVSYINKL